MPVRTDRLRLTLGARGTRDVKGLEGSFVNLLPDPAAAFQVASLYEDQEESFDLLTGRVALTYDLAPTVTAYASIARGAKSGGYQFFSQTAAFGAAQVPFKDSSTLSYEAGMRGSVFEDRLRFAVSGFFTDTKDEQISDIDFVTLTPFIVNVDTQTYGGEFEASYQLNDYFALKGNVGLLQSEVVNDQSGLREGFELPFAPNFTAGLSLLAEAPTERFGWQTGGSVFAFANYQHVGEQYTDTLETAQTPAYDLVDIRVGWRNERAEIYVFAENLFDEDCELNNFNAGVNVLTGEPANLVVPGPPRIVGIGATIKLY